LAHERHIGSSVSACTHGRSRAHTTQTLIGATHFGRPFWRQALHRGVPVLAPKHGRSRPHIEQTATGSW
jgi:hypothetical protein